MTLSQRQMILAHVKTQVFSWHNIHRAERQLAIAHLANICCLNQNQRNSNHSSFIHQGISQILSSLEFRDQKLTLQLNALASIRNTSPTSQMPFPPKFPSHPMQ